MTKNNKIPRRFSRIFSVWYRHYVVYTKDFLSNAFPPLLEPLFFLAAMGLGLGSYVGLIDGMPYVQYLAAGLIVPPAMFTAAFECSIGTYLRLEIDGIYDGMISSSLSVSDIFLGEILFAGSKGFLFSAIVLLIISLFGLVSSPFAILVPLGGFLTGAMFAALSLFVSSFVNNINHFNFYFTGILTPLFFFSGIVFPLDQFPAPVSMAAAFFPLVHPVRIVRALCFGQFDLLLLANFAYCLVFFCIFTLLAVFRLRKRLIL